MSMSIRTSPVFVLIAIMASLEGDLVTKVKPEIPPYPQDLKLTQGME